MLTNHDEINTIATKIRAILNIKHDNSNLNEIIKKLGGTIIFNSFCDSKSKVIKTSSNNFEIQLNNIFNSADISFFIAHELGHLFLHMKYLINPTFWESIPNGFSHDYNNNLPYAILENEADLFASSFLMPKDEFIKIVYKTSDNSYYYPSQIAEYFNVTIQLAKFRGKNLGLWE